MKTVRYELSQTQQVAADILPDLKKQDSKVVTLTGDLGVGKTTLMKAIMEQLGYQGVVLSPTFTYVNVYECANGLTVFHFDLYRLNSQVQFEQLGFLEYLEQPNSLVFIEWPEVIVPILPKNSMHLALTMLDDCARQLVY